MPSRVLIKDYPHRILALASENHVLYFRHTNSLDTNNLPASSLSSLPLPATSKSNLTSRCMVEFVERSKADLQGYRSLTTAKGTLGLITLNNDVFICVVTGSQEVAVVRPGETVQKIFAVEFYCLNKADYDLGVGYEDYPVQYTTEDHDYTPGHDHGENVVEHPFLALKKLLNGGSFYYSVDFDLTRRLQDRVDAENTVDISSIDEGLLWNSYMIKPLIEFRSRLTPNERADLDHSRMLTSVVRGFVRTLSVPPSSSPIRRKISSQAANLTVISRLSSRRAGTRYNSRGIDDDGNVANFVETETVFWSPAGLCFSYVQIRGSVPIFWESASSLIPGQQKITISRSAEATQPSFDRHLIHLERTYGAVHIVNLLSASKPGEIELSERYRQHVARSPYRRYSRAIEGEHDPSLLRMTEFDFHEKARHAGGYDGAKAIKPLIEASAEAFVYSLLDKPEGGSGEINNEQGFAQPLVVMQQNGVFRVNCLDCLDRTNLVQTLISHTALELFLAHRDERGNSDFWMRHSTLWADNGDALSKIYAGTGALKSSFTRHGKMSLAGAFADARKSATRLYVNHFEDKGRQNTVDLLLGRLVGQMSVELFDPINDWVTGEVGKRRIEFESRDTINVWVGTFNLNGKTKGLRDDLSAWLNVKQKTWTADLVVIGFQEIVELSPQQIMSTDPAKRIAWERAVRDCINEIHLDEEKNSSHRGSIGYSPDDYVLLRSGQLVGAALLIFVKATTLPRIKNVEGSMKKTGMSGMAGNKGAVAVRMEIESTSVCFVTAHLAAGFGNYDERNRDYLTITSGLRFQRDRNLDDHEIVMWVGDFNYRIGLEYKVARHLVDQCMRGDPTESQDALMQLYDNDQLNIQMVHGNVFPHYREGPIGFLPTYKFDLGRDEYDSSEKARIPAWTDRVLWKVDPGYGAGSDTGSGMRLLEYDSVMKLRFSDHRPVFARFEMAVRVVDEDKKETLVKKLYEKRMKEAEIKGLNSTDELDLSGEGSGSDELEDLMGYQSVQEGLPPASSDRRKWWLDGDRTAKSTLQPPKGELWMLNERRSANPWRAEADEEEWVQVGDGLGETGYASVESDMYTPKPRLIRAGTSSTIATSKPEPPLPPVSRRPVPPPWNPERNVSSPSIRSVSGASTITKPAPPPARRSQIRNSGQFTPGTPDGKATSSDSESPLLFPIPREMTAGATGLGRRRSNSSPSIASLPATFSGMSTAGKKSPPSRTNSNRQPPRKPSKPLALTAQGGSSPLQGQTFSTSILPSTATTGDTVPFPRMPSISSQSGINAGGNFLDGAGDTPPPLPRRSNTASTTSSFVSVPEVQPGGRLSSISSLPGILGAMDNEESGQPLSRIDSRRAPPPIVQPRRVSRLIAQSQGAGASGLVSQNQGQPIPSTSQSTNMPPIAASTRQRDVSSGSTTGSFQSVRSSVNNANNNKTSTMNLSSPPPPITAPKPNMAAQAQMVRQLQDGGTYGERKPSLPPRPSAVAPVNSGTSTTTNPNSNLMDRPNDEGVQSGLEQWKVLQPK